MGASAVDVRDMLCAQALAVVGGALKRLAPGEPVDIQYNAADVREDLVRWAADRGHAAVEAGPGRLCLTKKGTA